MSKFCHVENGAIDFGPRRLPKAWRNISGLDHMDAAGLKEIGWLPVRYVDPAFDPLTQVRTGPDYVVAADEVVGTYSVRDKTSQELDDEKETEINSEMGRKFIKAIVAWVAPLVGKTTAEARAEIKAIYKGLP